MTKRAEDLTGHAAEMEAEAEAERLWDAMTPEQQAAAAAEIRRRYVEQYGDDSNIADALFTEEN